MDTDNLRLGLQRLREIPDKDRSTQTLQFVSEGSLRELLTQEKIENSLASPSFSIPNHQHKFVAAEIFENGRKIFAILIELRLEAKLTMFLERCVMDSALPLSEAKLSEIIPESASHFQKLQWEYIPFKFREHFHSALEPQRILPFIRDKQFSSSGFSTVYKVTVHSLYQNWDHSHKAQVSRLSFYLADVLT
jgi:hypothetical protein